MREEPCKTYGHLFPADQHIADAVGAVLSDWNIPECTELEGDIFRISFEGVFFPLDDVLDALRPLLCAESSGKIDLIDMEGVECDEPDCKVPWPTARNHAAVLAPWLDMDPDARLGKDPVSFLLAMAPDAAQVGLLTDNWIIGGTL